MKILNKIFNIIGWLMVVLFVMILSLPSNNYDGLLFILALAIIMLLIIYNIIEYIITKRKMRK